MSNGIEFESKTVNFLKCLFKELGFPIIEARQQKAGTQNGFDIRISFLDNNKRERQFYFECKNYNKKLSWKEISVKIHELHSSNHSPDGYIVLSPHVDFSNIHINVIDRLSQTIQAPIKYWTPETNVQEYFSMDALYFEYVYNKKTEVSDNEKKLIQEKIRWIIYDMLRQKDKLKERATTNELTGKVPRINNDDIFGRENELKELRHLLFDKKKQIVVVNGLGGIGKTTLAQAYISKYLEDYKNVAWITQLSEDIVSDIANTEGLAESLSISRSGMETEQLFYEILSRLKALPTGPNLMVLDNVDDKIAKYSDYLPGQPHWHLLTTSRMRIDGFYSKELDFLSLDKAIALFKKHCYLINIEDEIADLIKAVDYHTLTIEILAKTAQFQRANIETLKTAIKNDLKANVYIPHKGKGERIDRIRSYLSSIFNLSDLTKDEMWLMKQFACLPTEFHNYNTLLEVIDPDEGKKELFAEICNSLYEQGWLLYNSAIDSYKMHLVVQEVAIQQTTLDDIDRLVLNVIRNLEIDQTKDNPVDKFRWIPFGYAILNNFDDNISDEISILQNNLALAFQSQGDYAIAKMLLEKSVQRNERIFGAEDPRTAKSYSNLGTVLHDEGDLVRAEKFLQKALYVDELNFGPNHSTTASSYSNLALVLIDQRNYLGAKELLEKAFHSDKQNFGLDHPTTMARCSNLATILLALRDYSGATELLEKVSVSNEKNFGLDHSTTALGYSNLALALLGLGDQRRALEFSMKGLFIFKKNLPEGHPYIKEAENIHYIVKSNLRP